MRHHLLLLLFSLLSALGSFAQESGKHQQLSDEAEFVLMTMGPGQDQLYAAFGHSALRLVDPKRRMDITFNFGIFNFDQPNFYLNFTKGKLHYKLGIKQYKRTLAMYIYLNRTITEQTLNLSQDEKQSLYELLVENAKPENAYYFYNYCYDNCSTRIRDAVEQVLGDRLVYDFDYASDSLSYRGLMDLYLDQQPWGDMGINVALGSEIDEIADGRAYTYMPEYLLEAYDQATITDGDSTRALIKATKIVNERVAVPDQSSPIKPIHFFIGVFFLVGFLTHRELKYAARYRMMDILLFGITGLLGCFLLFLWFGTDHLSQENYNILWCNPLTMVALVMLFKNKNKKLTQYYFIGNGLLLLFLILGRELMLQELRVYFIPLVLAMAIRSFCLALTKAKVTQD